MLLEGMPGIRVDDELVREIDRMITELKNVRSVSDPGSRVVEYRQVTLGLVRRLRERLRPASIDHLVLTRRYWAIVATDSATSLTAELVDLELVDMVARFENARDSTRNEIERWDEAGHVVVPDTNVFLHILDGQAPIAETDWHEHSSLPRAINITVVLPLTVLDELDRHKRTNNRTRAAATLRELRVLIENGTPVTLPDRATKLDLLVPELDHVPLPDADNEIIDQTLRLGGRLPRPMRAVLVTGDIGMVARARAAGVNVVHLET